MEQVDVVIIGSGYGGAIPAARLASAGMKVVVLERGLRKTAQDMQQSDDPRYIQSVVDVVVASDNVAFRTGKLVGGASIPMDGAHFRMPQKSFEVKDSGGRPYWPDGFSRAALDPYYARAEAMLSIRQFAWSEISKAGGLFAKMLDVAGASCERARLNYTDCVGCGFCAQGCRFGKKQNLLYNYIPLAESKGAEFRAEAEVDHLEPQGTGYVVHYSRAGVQSTIQGRKVIVAAGGIHTPALLLRSQPWLPRLSTHVGENFNNNGESVFVGVLPPEFDDLSTYRAWKGSDNAAVMTFHWFGSDGFTLHPGGGIEPTIFASRLQADGGGVLPKRSWGMEYKRFVESVYPHRLIAFSALGLADSHRAVVVRADGTPDLVPRDRTAFDGYLDRIEAIVHAAAAKSGVTLVDPTSRKLTGTTSAHLLSACRMAARPQDGVVDADCQVFGHPNLYVTDASAVPYALGVNPALTISALAERASDRIVAQGVNMKIPLPTTQAPEARVAQGRREFIRLATLAAGLAAVPAPLASLAGCAKKAPPPRDLDAPGLPSLGGAPDTRDGRTIAAFVDTIIPGAHRDPTGAKGGLDVGAPALFFDPALPALAIVPLLAGVLNGWAHSLVPGKDLADLRPSEREQVVEQGLQQLDLLELAIQLAKLAHYSSLEAGRALGISRVRTMDISGTRITRSAARWRARFTADGNLP